MEDRRGVMRVSKNLKLPFGEIKILVDNVSIEYTWENVRNDGTCPDLGGRYEIQINFKPDGKRHTISCILDYVLDQVDTDIESDESLECQSFCSENCKISIGVNGGIALIKEGDKLYSTYDYSINYPDNGMEYEIWPETETSVYTFGIAWLNNYNNENEAQTWFGVSCILYR